VRFEKTTQVSHPATEVLSVMIERMDEIVPFLPNVAAIDTQAREDLDDGRIRIVRRWQGSSDSIPAALRPFISEDLFAWIDTAIWTPDEFKVEWSLATSLAQLYDCSGVNYFGPHPESPETATQIRITGDLTVHADQLPGIPWILSSRLTPQIESFIVGLITPNLTDVGDGLQGYLDSGD
jgi:hypothetical protein